MTVGPKHTLSCIVKNRAGVLARVAGSFAEKGISITSLSVAEMEEDPVSRMTIVMRCDPDRVGEMLAHLRCLPDVTHVDDLDRDELIERELALLRVRAKGEDIARVMQLVEVFRASVAGMGRDTLTIEMSGPESKVDALVGLLRPFGIVEMARTGRVAIEHVEDADVG